MTISLFKKYRKLIEQAFLPIFVSDDFDTETLLEACRLADLSGIEYTLRRSDAKEIIPTLKKRFPHTVLLVGSTIDADEIVETLKEKHTQLLTLEELAPYTDGFVSMLPYSNETLKKYTPTHICVPTAESCGEALRQIKSGAAFIKVLGPDFSFSKKLHAAPTFNFCPTLITGGVTEERMEEAFVAGNIICAAGFDLILKGENPKTLTPQKAKMRIENFVRSAKAAREKAMPFLTDVETLSDEEFLKVLPHYCSIK